MRRLLVLTLLPIGRVPRWRFLLVTLLGVAAWLPVFGGDPLRLIAALFVTDKALIETMRNAPVHYYGLGVFGSYLTWIAMINRMHDRGRSGWWLLLAVLPLLLLGALLLLVAKGLVSPAIAAQLIVPIWLFGVLSAIVLIWLTIDCLFAAGDEWSNAYGRASGER